MSRCAASAAPPRGSTGTALENCRPEKDLEAWDYALYWSGMNFLSCR
jgi:hypothetical protein